MVEREGEKERERERVCEWKKKKKKKKKKLVAFDGSWPDDFFLKRKDFSSLATAEVELDLCFSTQVDIDHGQCASSESLLKGFQCTMGREIRRTKRNEEKKNQAALIFFPFFSFLSKKLLGVEFPLFCFFFSSYLFDLNQVGIAELELALGTLFV